MEQEQGRQRPNAFQKYRADGGMGKKRRGEDAEEKGNQHLGVQGLELSQKIALRFSPNVRFAGICHQTISRGSHQTAGHQKEEFNAQTPGEKDAPAPVSHYVSTVKYDDGKTEDKAKKVDFPVPFFRFPS